MTDIEKKYRLVKRGILCLPKEQLGSGILNLELEKAHLISKWSYKFINEEGVLAGTS